MSLLLLLPQEGGGSFTWTVVGTNASTWTTSHYDFYNIWNEWSTSTWSIIQSSGRTWEYIAGFTFTTGTSPVTAWTSVIVSTTIPTGTSTSTGTFLDGGSSEFLDGGSFNFIST